MHSLDALPASEESMQTMSRDLEKSLHQVKVDNVYVPENHKQYRGKNVEKVYIDKNHKGRNVIDALWLALSPELHKIR